MNSELFSSVCSSRDADSCFRYPSIVNSQLFSINRNISCFKAAETLSYCSLNIHLGLGFYHARAGTQRIYTSTRRFSFSYANFMFFNRRERNRRREYRKQISRFSIRLLHKIAFAGAPHVFMLHPESKQAPFNTEFMGFHRYLTNNHRYGNSAPFRQGTKKLSWFGWNTKKTRARWKLVHCLDNVMEPRCPPMGQSAHACNRVRK